MIKFRIFTASPNDVSEEREALSNIIIPELRRVFSSPPFFTDENQIELESVRSETHTWPDIGKDAQDVINKQLSPFDVFVGIMWKRFGTPTKRADSGTGEEFERAYDLYKKVGHPKIMFYFRTASFYPKDREEIAQVDKVLEFKQKLEELGVRYWSYEQPIHFERYVREHLMRQLFDMVRITKEVQLQPTELPELPQERKREIRAFLSYAREDREQAVRIHKDLEKAGIKAWIDSENLLPGQAWQKEIERAIEESDHFLALLSSHSITKKGFIQKELNAALHILDTIPESKIFILPIRLDEFNVPHGKLSNLHWVDMFPDWQEGIRRILQAMNVQKDKWKKLD